MVMATNRSTPRLAGSIEKSTEQCCRHPATLPFVGDDECHLGRCLVGWQPVEAGDGDDLVAVEGDERFAVHVIHIGEAGDLAW